MNTPGLTRLVLLYGSFYCGCSRYISRSLGLVFLLWSIPSLGPCGIILVFLLNGLPPILPSIFLGS